MRVKIRKEIKPAGEVTGGFCISDAFKKIFRMLYFSGDEHTPDVWLKGR
jgi:hypothetical protein